MIRVMGTKEELAALKAEAVGAPMVTRIAHPGPAASAQEEK